MKIVLFILDISKNGGTERVVSVVANTLSRIGYDVTICSIYSQNDVFFSIDDKVTLIWLNYSKIPDSFISKVRWNYKLYFGLKKYLLSNKFEISIGTSHSISTILSIINDSSKKVAYEHINLDTIPGYIKLVMKYRYPKLSGLILLTAAAAEKMIKYNEHLYVIPNMIDIPKESSLLQDKSIVMVGRISREKGYERVIEIAKSIKSTGWRIKIYGNGDPQLKNELIQNISEENLSEVIVLMGVSGNLDEIYLGSSILMMTSYTEAFPMVILEAMSYGLPVIAYSCNGINDIITNDYNGFVIGDNDCVSYGEKLKILIDDYALRNEFGENSKETIKNYSVDKVLAIWNETIINILYGKDITN